MKLHYNLDGSINVIIKKDGEIIFDHQFKNEKHYEEFFKLFYRK